MKTNEVLDRYNFLSKIILKKDQSELSKDLKVKIMKAKIEYGKVAKSFNEDCQEFVQQIMPERYKELSNIDEESRTDEQKEELSKLINEINSQSNLYYIKRINDTAEVNEVKFTEDEYNEIVEVNADNNTKINNIDVTASDFLEGLYDMFV